MLPLYDYNEEDQVLQLLASPRCDYVEGRLSIDNPRSQPRFMTVERKVTRWSRHGFNFSFDGEIFGNGDTRRIRYFLAPIRVNTQYVQRLQYTRMHGG